MPTSTLKPRQAGRALRGSSSSSSNTVLARTDGGNGAVQGNPPRADRDLGDHAAASSGKPSDNHVTDDEGGAASAAAATKKRKASGGNNNNSGGSSLAEESLAPPAKTKARKSSSGSGENGDVATWEGAARAIRDAASATDTTAASTSGTNINTESNGNIKVIVVRTDDALDKPFRTGRKLSSAGMTFAEIVEEEWFQELFRSHPDRLGLLLLGMGMGYSEVMKMDWFQQLLGSDRMASGSFCSTFLATPPDRPMGILWDELRDSPELIGRVGSFVPTDRFLAMIDKEMRSIVRRQYLRGNEWFLIIQLDEGIFNDTLVGADLRPHEDVCECFELWLKENEDAWRQRSLGTTWEGNLREISLDPAVLSSLSRVVHSGYGLSLEGCANSPGVDEDFIIISIDGREVHSMGREEIFALLDANDIAQGSRATVQYMRWFDWALSHPATLSTMGALGAFKHLLATGTFSLSQTFFYDDDYKIEEAVQMPLLWVTLLAGVEKASPQQHLLPGPEFKIFRHLLDLGSSDFNETNPASQIEGERPIHYCAAQSGVPISLFKALIDHTSVNLDARDAAGNTALHYAVDPRLRTFRNYLPRLDIPFDIGNIAKVTLLLEAGADPSIQNNDGFSPNDTLLFLLGHDNLAEYNRTRIIQLLGVLSRFS